jgi:uncharacterized membrane protein YecN with MAPEG domain
MSVSITGFVPVPITALYATVLALIVTALAINVTRHRAKLKVPLGDGGNPQMLRMIRIHANAIEYVPISLLLMSVYELNGGTRLALHMAGIALVVSRLLHAWGMWSQAEPTFGRFVGQSLAWLTLVILALLNLWQNRMSNCAVRTENMRTAR